MIGQLVEGAEGELSRPVRIGKVGGNRPRMLRVVVANERTREDILRKAPELNKGISENRKKIYINPDYTMRERERNKALRDELKRRRANGEEDLVIRGSQIVVKKKAGDTSHREQDLKGPRVPHSPSRNGRQSGNRQSPGRE